MQFENEDIGPGSCPKCGSSKIVTSSYVDNFEYGAGVDSVTLSAVVPLHTCQSCGFAFIDDHAEDARHNALCAYLGLLRPGDIRELRHRHGLSRAEFADLTKIGEATLGRWERGSNLQTAAYDLYLRLLYFPDNVDRLRGLTRGSYSLSERSPSNIEETEARQEIRFRAISESSFLSKQEAFQLCT